MSMDNFKSSVSLPSLPIQLVGGIRARQQHYLRYTERIIISNLLYSIAHRDVYIYGGCGVWLSLVAQRAHKHVVGKDA